MSDLTDTLRDIATPMTSQEIFGFCRTLNRTSSRQLVLDHYKQVLLEAQRDADWQDLLKADPAYIEWANRIDSQEGK